MKDKTLAEKMRPYHFMYEQISIRLQKALEDEMDRLRELEVPQGVGEETITEDGNTQD